jgi:hypothetical protein
MIPFDGTGYGRSIYWQMKAKEVAKRKHEYCPCWDLNNPVIRPSQEGKLDMKIHCFLRSTECRVDFHRTEKVLTRKFKEMYGINTS